MEKIEPTHTDVLSGRGVSTNKYPGNENFRHIIMEQMDLYALGTKSQKMALSKAVVERLHNEFTPPGRFLKKDSETGQWVELTLKEAAGKTAQAFAYAIRDRARQNKEEQQNEEKSKEVRTNVSGTKRPASPAASLNVVNKGHSSASALDHDEREGARKRKKSMGTSSSDQPPLRLQQPQPQFHQASAATVANSDAAAALSILAQIRSSQQNNQSLQNLAALQQLFQQPQTQQGQAQLAPQSQLAPQLARAILNAQQQSRALQASQSLFPSSQGAHSASELLLRRMLLQGNPLALSQRELQLQGLLLQSNPLSLSTEQLQLQDSLRNSLQNQSILSLGGSFSNQQVLPPQVQPNLQQLALMQQVNTIAEFLRHQQDNNNNNGERKQG